MKTGRLTLIVLCASVLASCGLPATPTSTPQPSATMTATTTITPTPTIEPTPTETITPTPTELPRFTELIPATKEECRSENVIRYDHFEEDWQALRAKEDEVMAGMEIKGEANYLNTVNNSGSGSTLDSDIVEFTLTKTLSCSYLETDSKHNGLFVFGIPYLSSYDNQPHIYHAAVDWDNLDAIISYTHNDSAVQKVQEHLDYSFLLNGNYKRILASYIAFFNNDAGNPLFSKLENIYSLEKVDISAKLGNGSSRQSHPDYIQKVNDSIFPCDYIWFE